ncbi:uncharacterized protein METZ01_LOCUS296090 [marine metagenome]|uniref:Cupin type-2 domain-containing protein n=1 Tax=marine metagenome TaxID=408172 RepID=A0A382M2Y5_9ZZZZ
MNRDFHRFASAPDEGPWLATLLGHQVRIKTSGKDTDGKVAVFEFIEKPHSLPPPFTRHAFIEVFYILDGTLTFQFLNQESFEATPGTVITVPSLKPHTFWNRTCDSSRVLDVCAPAGLDSFFEESETILKKVSQGSDDEMFLAEMRQLRERYGLEHVAPPPEDTRD